MLLIILILTAILIGLIVYVLRKDQQRRYADIVEQGQNLPPLELLEQAEDSATTDVPGKATAKNTGKEPWKERCKTHREHKQFKEAVAAAQEAWPQWQSYEQITLTLRAEVKASKSPAKAEQTIIQLYRAAAEAHVLYDRPPGQSAPRWQTVAQSTSRQQLEQLSYDWQNLGYLHLKLLTATDIKNMTKLWGEPLQHQSQGSLKDN